MTGGETRYIGAGLHFEINTAPMVLNLLLELLNDGLRAAELSYYQVVSKPGFLRLPRITRRSKIEQGDLERTFQQWVEGEVNIVRLYKGAKDCSEPVEIEIDRATDSQMLLSLVMPERLCRSVDILSLFKCLAQAGQCFFGHIDPGYYLYAKSLSAYYSIGIDGNDRLRSRFISEVERLRDCLDDYRTSVPRAAWANLLSPAHVTALGGIDYVRNSCSCYLIEEWGENLYLQLTASPCDIQVAQVIALGEFLEPVRVAKDIEPLYKLW